MQSLQVPPEIAAALAANAAVGISASGGKDSAAVAIATIAYLDKIGHKGPRLLIHADLGRIEWQDSITTCQRPTKLTESMAANASPAPSAS